MIDTVTDPVTLGPFMPKRPLPPIVKQLIAWRKQNRLSQTQAALVISKKAGKITRPILRTWEQGITRPSELEALGLRVFLDENPVITDPPPVGRPKTILSDAQVRQIRRMREHGATLAQISEKYGLSIAAVSLICTGKRRQKPYER